MFELIREKNIIQYKCQEKVNGRIVWITFDELNMWQSAKPSIHKSYFVEFKVVKKKHQNTTLKTTGDGSLDYLFWAKSKILEFEEFIKAGKIYVFWADNRRRRVYEWGLTKIGFKITMYDGRKCLCKEVKEQANG